MSDSDDCTGVPDLAVSKSVFKTVFFKTNEKNQRLQKRELINQHNSLFSNQPNGISIRIDILAVYCIIIFITACSMNACMFDERVLCPLNLQVKKLYLM